MNRTIKEATVKRFHYDDHAQLKKHLADFIDAHNFGRRLKTLKGLTPTSSSAKGGIPSRSIHYQPYPSNAGTEHLVAAG